MRQFSSSLLLGAPLRQHSHRRLRDQFDACLWCGVRLDGWGRRHPQDDPRFRHQPFGIVWHDCKPTLLIFYAAEAKRQADSNGDAVRSERLGVKGNLAGSDRIFEVRLCGNGSSMRIFGRPVLSRHCHCYRQRASTVPILRPQAVFGSAAAQKEMGPNVANNAATHLELTIHEQNVRIYRRFREYRQADFASTIARDIRR